VFVVVSNVKHETINVMGYADMYETINVKHETINVMGYADM